MKPNVDFPGKLITLFPKTFKGEFAVVPTTNYGIENMRWCEQHIYETVCHITNVTKPKVTYLRNLKWFLYVLHRWRILYLIRTKSFVWRNTSDHACQICCSKSNCETVYHWFVPLETTWRKQCTIWMFAPPTAIHTHAPALNHLAFQSFDSNRYFRNESCTLNYISTYIFIMK